jgi:hypothetical protein
MRIPAALLLCLATGLGACSSEDPGSVENDGSISDDGSTSNGLDGALDPDGAFDPDGAAIGPDGSLLTDGGDPLEQSLSEFCRGAGSVVTVGASGECAGEIAEETFQFALCACETISAQSGLELDAFDSRVGPYGGSNRSSDGHLGVNAGLEMDGKLTVHGAAYAGGGGFSVGPQSSISSTLYADGPARQDNSSTSIGRNAFINGDVLGRFEIAGELHVPATATVAQNVRVDGPTVREPITSFAPCPCGQDDILDVAALTTFGAMHNDNDARAGTSSTSFTLTSTAYADGGPGTLRLPCGRYYLTRLVQPGGLTIVVEGRTVLFVDGDLTIGGNFDLMLDGDDAEVDLFVRGSLSIGASARFGDASRPSKVRTYVGGDGEIVLSASAIFGGNLYAPRANVRFDASSTLYGALFAKNARFDGSSNIHFDSAVRAAGESCEEEESPGDAGIGDATSRDAATTSGGDASVQDGSEVDCADDLDCQAPLVCIGGACMLSL